MGCMGRIGTGLFVRIGTYETYETNRAYRHILYGIILHVYHYRSFLTDPTISLFLDECAEDELLMEGQNSRDNDKEAD